MEKLLKITKKKRYIIGKFYIPEDEQNIKIINSYEQFLRDNNRIHEKKYENEKEIKDNCEIFINSIFLFS